MGNPEKNIYDTKRTLKRILSLIKPYGFFVVLSLLFAAGVVTLTLYAPILVGNAVDLIVGPGNVDFAGIKAILLEIIIVVAFTAVFQWLMNLCNNHITYSIVAKIRTQAFNHIQGLPLRYIDANQSGTIINRVITDVDQFSDGLLMGFTQLFTGVATIVGTLFFMLSINVWITLVVVLITPLSFFVAGFVAKKTYVLFRRQSEIRGEMTGLIDEMVGNQKIVQAFNHQKEAIENFEEINERLKDCSHKAIFFSSVTNPATRFVNSIVYAGVGITGAFAAINGMLSVGQLSCFLSYANQYTKPFNEISGVITELQNALACAAKVFELLDEAEETEREDAITQMEAGEASVDLEHVYFSYNPEVKLLEDLNLSVKPGQRVAIVGPTGCGKSTLINLLMRFYDVDSGEIKIDGINTQKMTRNVLRERFGMVLQETWLQAGTIRDNIAYGNPDATQEEIINAAKMAHAHSFIKRLPQGYDTVLAENGGNLSQGQKQLLCIARVMLKLPPMLILDEATSSIDTRTEIRIQKAFNTLMEGRTSFVVAHRLSTIRESDIILVMKNGNIIEQGTHEELLKMNGFYTELYNSQFAH
ncbi:MAG: ABC transporter ATP-binding protein [Thermoflexaceae bacterium]|nr:ABC transporter ATP-binding protein [Thermoflexaceae bacterium]